MKYGNRCLKIFHVDDFFFWIRINSVETITSVFLHIPFVFSTYYLTDMIMSWYGNGFHITAPFVKEFHNTLVDYPHRGPVMQRFSVSFVVSLNKLLNQQFSCWLFETLCDTFMSHHDIIAKYIFLLFCISFLLNTHTCYKTYFFVFNQFSPRLQQLLYFRLCLVIHVQSLSGVPDYFYRNKISSGGDLSHYSSASLY